MAKSTHGQEVSTGTSDSYTEHELQDPVVIRRAEIGYVDRKEELKSLGTDSSQSSGNEKSQSDNNRDSDQPPAQTTESHSDPQEQETDSTAHSTDGGTPKRRTRQSGRARARSVPDDDDFDFDD